jgi:NTE family protein
VPAPGARRGVLFGLASSITGATTPEFDSFAAKFPEHRTFTKDGVEQDLSFVPTVFDRLEPGLVASLVYRGWWLTGASLAQHQPGFATLPPDVIPPTREP